MEYVLLIKGKYLLVSATFEICKFLLNLEYAINI